jgi:hypothetical protein
MALHCFMIPNAERFDAACCAMREEPTNTTLGFVFTVGKAAKRNVAAQTL